MKKLLLSLLMVMVAGLGFKVSASAKTRIVELSGVVVDSKSMQGLANVEVLDQENKKIGETDAKGYFAVKVPTNKKGDALFSVKLKKEGYNSFVQEEHWGDLDTLSGSFYFGMQKEGSGSLAFSKLLGNQKSYDGLQEAINHIKVEQDLLAKLQNLTKDNDDVLVKMGNDNYLVSKFNYFKLQAGDQHIYVNNKVVSIEEINKIVSRHNIKNLSKATGSAQYDLSTF